jgi:hypothetical protein
MLEDKLISKAAGNSGRFTAIKTREVRDRLRQYFNYDLIKFPTFQTNTESVASMTQPKVIKPIEKAISHGSSHLSVTDLTLSVSELMG